MNQKEILIIFFNGYLNFFTDLKYISDYNKPILTTPSQKQESYLKVGWNYPSDTGFYGKQIGSFVFIHTDEDANYPKLAMINIGLYWSDAGRLVVKYNVSFNFRNASLTRKYINVRAYNKEVGK
ncbi:hypothetical protein [Spiroplasma taiwanense]|uniref:Uncharacterized protein n=1 Tax=Spiroplasma taiwanense CT-1 TaxID=1276220 RepID=S5LZX7_9MOLU|nr:hypothetical protein [Spiroplasma taiwanense]AGR41287.1 hypothetical protein STAIW_v1c06690 [Spiroplasma taiwanense CT-1]